MKKTKQILSVFLSFCMIISCMVGMSVTASATSPTEWHIGDTINLNGKWFYNGDDFVTIGDANLYQSKDTNVTVPTPVYDYNTTYSYYSWEFKQTIACDGNSSNIGLKFANIPAGKTSADVPTGFRIMEGTGTEQDPYVFELVYGSSSTVTITAGSNMTKTTDSGAASQTVLSGAMTPVVYTANEGYYFPENYSVAAVNGISVTWNSYTQITVSGTPTANAEITLTAPTAKTTPNAPTTAAATDCTTADNNDGKLTGVTTAMEYKKSDAADWTAGTGSDITGLVPGTYYVRIKATDTTNASANQTLTIKGFISYTVTFKVVNGKWNDETTADKTVTLTGHDGDTLKLAANQIPAVGTKPNDTYQAGSWDTEPNTTSTITAATTYTYTYAQKAAQTIAAENVTATYGDTGKSVSASVTTPATGGGAISYAVTSGADVVLVNSTSGALTILKAGTATVTVTASETTEYAAATKDITVTINKADPTAPTGLTATVGQTLADVSLPDGWSWVDDTTTSVGEVGDNTFKANFAGNDNYKAVSNVDVTIKVSSSVTYTLVPAKAATCTATGNKEYYKGSDGKYYTKNGDTYTETTLAAVTIAKTAHTLTAVAAVDAKCTTDGTKAHYKCSVCEKLFEDADGKTETTADALKVAALGHNYVGGTCTRCGATDPNYGGSSGGYTPVIPSGSTTTTTTTTTTNTGSFADKTEENNNYAGAEINMKTEDLEKAVLTDEDKKVIDAGGNVTVELEVEEKTPTAEEKKEVEAAVEAAKEASGEDYTVAMYFDANLFKTSNGTKTQLHETNGKIAVSFKLPAQFKNTDSSVTRTYAVARIHDGKTEILVCEYDPETDLLTFYTDKFSTYALMYEDAKADDVDVSAVDDDDEQGDEGAVDDEQFDETDDDFDELTDDEGGFDDDFAEDQTDGDSNTDNDDQAAVDAVVDNGETNPNTGAPLAEMGVFAVMSFFAAAAAYTAKKRKNK